MPALLDWVETLRDVWTGFVAEVVLDPEAKGELSAQTALVRNAVVGAQSLGYVFRTIVIPTEPGIDPAQYTGEAFDGVMRRHEQGEFDSLMLIGEWPGTPEDFLIVSLLWQEHGLFRFESSLRYLHEIGERTDLVEPLLDTVRLAWATCRGMSGWANIAVAGEPEQADEIKRIAEKWERKSEVTLVDLTPPGNTPQPIGPRPPRACWLTLLSPADIVVLGGLEKLDAALPADMRLEVFEDGGVLIQLTPTPAPPEANDVEEKYRSLSTVLAPLANVQ